MSNRHPIWEPRNMEYDMRVKHTLFVDTQDKESDPKFTPITNPKQRKAVVAWEYPDKKNKPCIIL